MNQQPGEYLRLEVVSDDIEQIRELETEIRANDEMFRGMKKSALRTMALKRGLNMILNNIKTDKEVGERNERFTDSR